jgi:hypothetical protein
MENVFGSKRWVERRKAWESALLLGKPSSNYMRVCGKHFKKEDYVCKLNSILRLYFEMIYNRGHPKVNDSLRKFPYFSLD